MRFLYFLLATFLLSGCAADAGQAPESGTPPFDSSYLTSDLWNDGQAEVAFYQVTRNRDQYGQDVPQSFLAGTYVVKHDFDEALGSKAAVDAEATTPAFKYAFFYEFESRSYEYKRSWVVNAAQQDLRPLKASFASFDWCANQYREYTFRDGQVEHLYRSDDYGNDASVWDVRGAAYPASLVPMLVRAIPEGHAATLRLITPEGAIVPVQLRADNPSMRLVAGETREVVAVHLDYQGEVLSMLGETTAPSEVWFRLTGEDRVIAAVEAADGRYRMELVEHLRSPYWRENLYERLNLVQTRP